jgi:glycerol-3-phosphate dehydrogenase
MGGTKGSHIVVGSFDGAPRNALYVEAKADSRPIFIIPWNRQYLIGTTDIRVEGDPIDAEASDEEIAYLIAETNRVFPQAGLQPEDIHFAYAGVRPLPYKSKGPESAITRRHIIKRHGGRERGLISIIGGKLTTYRNLAEQTVDRASKMLRRRAAACATRTTPLPGAEDLQSATVAADAFDALSPAGRERLIGIYGARVKRLRELVTANPSLGRTRDEADTVLAAEVALATRDEFALQLTDIVHRRLMIGLSANLGAHVTLSVASTAAAELGWGSAEAERQLAALNAYNARLRRRD